MKKLFCLTDKRKFKANKFIVIYVDDGRPMFFDGRIFVFAEKSGRSKAPVEVYTRKQANFLIRQTVSYINKSLNWQAAHKSNYSLMPVY